MKYKTVLITGATGSIGEAIAEKFAVAGCNLLLNYCKSTQVAKDLKAKLDKFCHVEIFKADVRNQTEIDAMYKFSKNAFGAVNAIINCAGCALYGLLSEYTDSEIDQTININLTGTIKITRAFMQDLVSAKEGSIINISSIWGIVGASCESVYSATKAGVIVFTKALAKELGPSNITVNCIAPGFVNSKMNAQFNQDDVENIIANTPLGRLATVSDVARVAYFFASEDARCITGQTLAVDGGFTL
ncbi:MAG: SDR family oxidoreductase [Christensenellaceae bacterium]|jgi:3-oxoacyl-[acyl-carrier protein] reductase|nr:SDR family oxidoreductase [Christensenellaceae bacterium]